MTEGWLWMFGEPYMLRAMLAAVLIGIAGGYLGSFVVQRGMSFLGHGLAHGAFGGVALGLLLGVEPLWIALPFTVAVALGIAWLSGRTKLNSDTSIGIFFSLSMALGMVFLSLLPRYSTDAFAYLFGSILAVNATDLWVAAGLLLVLAACIPLWGRWAYSSFDREGAQADGLPVLRDDYLLSALIAISVVVAVKVVGALLVSAFLVIPAASARMLCQRFSSLTLVATVIALLTALLGLLASCWLDLPSGAAIVLLQGLVFAAAWGLGSLRQTA